MKFNKARALQLLKDAGYTKVVVSYSGGNDEGGVDEIVVTKDGVEKEFVSPAMPQRHNWYKAETNPVVLTPEQELYTHLTQPVYDEWYGFGGEFYVNGTITFDVQKGTVKKNQSVQTPSTAREEEYL